MLSYVVTLVLLSWLHLKLLTLHHTHTHPFNGPFSGTTWVSRYQKGKTNLDFTEARDSEWQWHQLGHICKSASRSRQITMPVPHHSFFTGRMPFLPPNQQRHSTEGITSNLTKLFLQCFCKVCTNFIYSFAIVVWNDLFTDVSKNCHCILTVLSSYL